MLSENLRFLTYLGALMTQRLWDKGSNVNAFVHAFTVGDDPQIDLALVRWDAMASAAHARMLSTIDILTASESAQLCEELSLIAQDADNGQFTIPLELEDCHTAIENRLTQKLGEVGKKIHTGRSRNDQVLVASRLYIREQMLCVLSELLSLVRALEIRSKEHRTTPMPGYTHLQRAMPTTVGTWFQAFVEHAQELLGDGLNLLRGINKNPLGVASGFGVPLNLNREMTAQLLAFDQVQRNPIYVQNSRGRMELKVVRWMTDIAMLIEKLSWDMLLYSTKEFGFFSLPAELTTGSSIMPQKHNPDVLELLRAASGKIRGSASELEWITAKLPSNYHRDFQYTKAPFIRASQVTKEIVPVMSEVVRSIFVNAQKLEEAMSPELYSTYDAYREVKAGVPFRTAYVHAAQRLESGAFDPSTVSQESSFLEHVTAQEAATAAKELQMLEKEVQNFKKRCEQVESSVFVAS